MPSSLSKLIRNCSLVCYLCASALNADLPAQVFKGEFTDIKLGRQMMGRDSFPSIAELRREVAKEEISSIALIRLHRDGSNIQLPMWSPDGERLAFQSSKLGDRGSSELMVFNSLDEVAQRISCNEKNPQSGYDFMFRWERTGWPAFSFVRMEPDRKTYRLFVSEDGTAIREEMATSEGTIGYPEMFRRSDGIWMLIFQQGDKLAWRSWSDRDERRAHRVIADGGVPSWGRDGNSILYVRLQQTPRRETRYSLQMRKLNSQEEVALRDSFAGVLRSPSWSPQEKHVAYYATPGDRANVWTLEVNSAAGGQVGHVVSKDVVVNNEFTSQGPAWSSDGQKLWFISNDQRKADLYYPLAMHDMNTRRTSVVDYHKACKSPRDVAVNPVSKIPEIAFVAQVEEEHNLFVLLLNHD